MTDDPYDDPYDPYKVCPECGGEYVDTAEVCVDCEVPLVLPGEIEERNARELPLAPGLILLCTAPIQWTRALAGDLAQAGLAYAVDRREAKSEGLLSLYVRREDRKAATELDDARMRIDPLETDETDAEPAAAESKKPAPEPDHKVCPECGGEYVETAKVCVDCEVPLVLPGEIEERNARELPLTKDLILLCTAPILWVRALAGDLEQSGIAYAVDRREAKSEGLLSLYVRREDRKAATELDDARMRIDPLETDETDAEPAAAESKKPAPEPDHKVCPECGGEYRLEIARCADCDVDLVLPTVEEVEEETGEEDPETEAGLPAGEWDEDEEEDDEPVSHPAVLVPPQHEIPASDDLVCLCCGYSSVLAGLSPALDDAGIGHRIERAPYRRNATDCCVYLKPEDCDAAELIWNTANYTDDGFVAEGQTCPACGAPLVAQTPACTDCGLSLAVEAETDRCAHCGAIWIGPAGTCPNCGEMRNLSSYLRHG